MQAWIQDALNALLTFFSVPGQSLSAIFIVAFVSATLLPLGSEPVVFGVVQLQPHLFWPAVLVATAGNTLGGALDWWLGFGAKHVVDKHRGSRAHAKALQWLQRLGPKACLLSWLPLVGDPLCAVAGWLRLPFWPCVLYMAIGKFLRYTLMTAALVWVF